MEWEENPNVILILTSPQMQFQDACELPHNSERYIPPIDLDSSESGSRRTTPDIDPISIWGRIQLTFDKPPKDILRGFAFGTDKARCDILLAEESGQGGISDVHFYITFDNEGRIILKDVSENGTTVSFGDWGKDEKRSHFTWILEFSKTYKNNVRAIVQLPERFYFEFKLGKYSSCEAAYQENVESYMKRRADTIMDLGDSDVERDIPIQSLAATQEPAYLTGGWLGSGGYGRVVLVRDVSTGLQYAAKELYEVCMNDPEEEKVEQAVRIASFKKEITIMKTTSHVRAAFFPSEGVLSDNL